MKWKLICVDIDGTLLTDDKQLLPPVKRALRKAWDQGIRIALISGRMPAGVDRVEDQLDIPCIKACTAGTYTLMDGQVLNAEYMPPDVLRKIDHTIVRKYGIPLWIFRDRQWYVTGVDDYIRREIQIIGCRPEIVNGEELARTWEAEGKGLNKLLIAAEPERLAKISQDIQNARFKEVDTARSADTFLEIFPRGCSKGKALQSICDKLGMDMEDAVAFGDQELDLPMIRAAGLGIAMGNAIEKVKESADAVTKTNNEGGVAFAVEKLLSGQRIA